ncbi:MAG TPA: hypothetical protein VFZ81_10155 [Burkholderiales bacterium]
MTPKHDDPPAAGDRFARESFTLRRMRPWQVWTAAVVAVGGLAAAIILT